MEFMKLARKVIDVGIFVFGVLIVVGVIVSISEGLAGTPQEKLTKQDVNDAYQRGYADGLDEGYSNGEEDGITRGKEQALEEFEREYELSRDYNFYRDDLVYFEFPENFELTYCEPHGKEDSHLRAIIEKSGFENESNEFIAFSIQNLMEFDILKKENREGFSMDDIDILEFMLKDDEKAICYEYKVVQDVYVGILYYDEDGDKSVDITKYQILKDGILYYFMYFPDGNCIPHKYIMDDILKSLELPSLETVKEYYD